MMARLFGAVVVLLALLSAAHGDGSTCQHQDRVVPGRIPRVKLNTAGRTKRTAMEQPFRVFPYYDTTASGLSTSLKERIQDDIIPRLTTFLQEALSVDGVVGPILLERDCSPSGFFITPEGRKCVDDCIPTTCGGIVTIPDEHLLRCQECGGSSILADCVVGDPSTDGAGVSSADYILYVSARSDVGPCASNTGSGVQTVAFAGFCQLEESLDRPIAGFVNFCPSGLTDSSDDFVFSVTKHEVLHAIVFSSTLFSFWRNPDGSPRTERDSNGFPALVDGQYVISNTTQTTVTYPEWQTRSGPISHDVTVLVTERITQEARDHFNCPSLVGMELENQGGDGTALQHWEKRAVGNEAMTGQFTFNPVFSRITFAALEDSGWYAVNYDLAEPLLWGKDAGCDFLSGSCGGWIEQQDGSDLPLSPFCDRRDTSPLRLGCTVARQAVSRCNLDALSNIPTDFQYFTSSSDLGGRITLMDYCPFEEEFPFTNRRTECADPNNAPGDNDLAETYGPDSRCVNHGEQWRRGSTSISSWGGGCYVYDCSSSGVTIFIRGAPYNCTCEGEELTIDLTVSSVRYRGSIICPSCAQICYDQLDDCPVSEPAACYGTTTNTGQIVIGGTTGDGGDNGPPDSAHPMYTPPLLIFTLAIVMIGLVLLH